MEVQGLPEFVPGGVVNLAGPSKWYTEVFWTQKDGSLFKEYICKLPVAIKESGAEQHNARVGWVNDSLCGFGVTMWTTKPLWAELAGNQDGVPVQANRGGRPQQVAVEARSTIGLNRCD